MQATQWFPRNKVYLRNKVYFAMGTRIKSQKIVEIKGTCTLRKQGNIVKYLWGTNEQKKRFQGNTGTQNTPPKRLSDIKTITGICLM